jgi:tricorn protease
LFPEHAYPAAEKPARIDARMMRHPDVSATQIAFVYAGDIWVAPKTGGEAVRLSSPRGEESFPKFSPDGTRLAFSGNYDGNLDIYVMPVTGGLPQRLTHHGAPDRMVGWYPDGRHILYATTMTSYKDRFNQLYKCRRRGACPRKLPMPYGEFGAISPDGQTIAYNPISVDFRTWKRYRGGMNPDLWLFDLTTFRARNLTQSEASESIPMWHGRTLYFLSDRDANKRFNLWAADIQQGKFRQVTFFTDYDVHFPSIGREDIVFENAGRLYLLDLKTEKYREVEITVTTDRATLRARLENVSGLLQTATLSPGGKRAVFEARGDLFSVPAEHGVVRNLTRSSGVAERHPAWSPDGRLIAYFSDRTGEYELTVRNAARSPEGDDEERTLTQLGPGYRYQPQWSPDSQKILWIDQTMRISVYDFATGTNRVIDQQRWMYHGALSRFRVSWSADSRWIAYAADQENRNSALVLYDYPNGKRHEVTAGFYNDEDPVFDPDGNTCSSARAAPSRRITATWTARGSTRTPAISPPCRCAKTSSHPSPRATTRNPKKRRKTRRSPTKRKTTRPGQESRARRERTETGSQAPHRQHQTGCERNRARRRQAGGEKGGEEEGRQKTEAGGN